MPPWRLSGAALFAQLICPRRFFVPARLLFFCFYSWPLGGEPYSLGLFYHGGILIPARFFVISHWPALGGGPHSLGLFYHGGILIPARFFCHIPLAALGGRPYSLGYFLSAADSCSRPPILSSSRSNPSAGQPYSLGLFCNGGIRVPAQLISIPVQRKRTIRSCLSGEGQDFFSSAISLEA